MKTCLLTVSIGDEYQKLLDISSPNMLKFCKNYNVDYFNLNELGNHIHPAFTRLELKNFLKIYDYVLYCDTDVIFKENCLNIFDLIKNEKNWDIMGLNEAKSPFFNKIEVIRRITNYSNLIEENVNFSRNPINYVNSGFIVVNEGFLKYFEKEYPERISGCNDQEAINLAIAQGKVLFKDIPRGFGEQLSRNSYRKEVNTIHLFGKPNGVYKRMLMKYFLEGRDLRFILSEKNKFRLEEGKQNEALCVNKT